MTHQAESLTSLSGGVSDVARTKGVRDGIANSKVAYEIGIRRFDSSMGGTGGCVTGAPGNQPTERLLELFEKTGIRTGVHLEKALKVSRFVERELYHKINLTAEE